MTIIKKSGLVLLGHSPYSSYLASSNYYLFRHLKKNLQGKIYKNNQELRQEIEQYLEDQSQIFFESEFLELFKKVCDPK